MVQKPMPTTTISPTDKQGETTHFTFASTRTTQKIDVSSPTTPSTTPQNSKNTKKPLTTSLESEQIQSTVPSSSPASTKQILSSSVGTQASTIGTQAPASTVGVQASTSVPSSTVATQTSKPTTQTIAGNSGKSTNSPTHSTSSPEASTKIKPATTTSQTFPINSTAISENLTQSEFLRLRSNYVLNEICLAANDASVGWTLIALLLAFLALIIFLFAFHKCRQFADSHSNLPMVRKIRSSELLSTTEIIEHFINQRATLREALVAETSEQESKMF